VIVNCAVYEDGRRRDGDLDLEDAGEAAKGADGFVWLGVVEPSTREFEAIAAEFDLHELAVEDAINAHQRPKVELYGDTLLVVLKTVRYVGGSSAVRTCSATASAWSSTRSSTTSSTFTRRPRRSSPKSE
jgi:magnesium transporter